MMDAVRWLRVVHHADGRVQHFVADGSLVNPWGADWVEDDGESAE